MAIHRLLRQRVIALLLMLTIMQSLPASAAEIDSYTGRYQLTEDALTTLNQELNRRFKFGIAGANQAMAGCW